MHYGNEADALTVTLQKLGQATALVGDERVKWQKTLGAISLDTPLEHMVRDHEILLKQVIEALGQTLVAVHDLLESLDGRSNTGTDQA